MDAGERIKDDGLPLRAIVERIESGKAFALAVVMKSGGSTPRAAGTIALIEEHGAITGTIGGGLVEAEAQKRGAEVIRDRAPVAFDFTYHGVSAAESDPICGGQMRVLVFPVEREHHAAFRAADQARRRRERGALSIQFACAAKPAVRVEFVLASNHGNGPDSFDEQPRRSGVSEERRHEDVGCESAEELLVVPLIPPPRLLIFGGGHVGQALARQASLVDFDITVIDDRPEFTAPERFSSGVTTICEPMDAAANRLPMDENTFVAIVTRGHPHDAAVLARCLHRPSAYLGMMGSRRKVELVRREFIESGRATAAEFDRVHAPIGLELGAQTVPEIAASIVAQLVAVRRKKAASRIPENPES